MKFISLLVIVLACGQQFLFASGFPRQNAWPLGIMEAPAFSVKNYAFYPDKELVGVYKYWVPPMSGSGIGHTYIDTLHGCDYHSFEFIDVENELSRDKNTVYHGANNLGISSRGVRVIPPEQKGSSFRIIKGNKIWIYIPHYREPEKIEYEADEIYSDIAFRKKDRVFVFYEGIYTPFPIVFDPNTLEHVDNALYQDCRNLYRFYASAEETRIDVIENEQITGSHFFHAYEEENRQHDKGRNYMLIGKKNLYMNDSKLSGHKMKTYHFREDSFYFLYNEILYYFYPQISFLSFPVGCNSGRKISFTEFYTDEELDMEEYPRWEYTKIKWMGPYALVYDNSVLFHKRDEIEYPVWMDLNKLEYVGQFPYRLYLELISDNHDSCENSGPIFRYEGECYGICGRQLAKLEKIEIPEYKFRNHKDKAYPSMNLKNLRFYNEYYFTDGKTLYCNDDIMSQMVSEDKGKNKGTSFLTSGKVDMEKLKVIGRYFTDGKKLYYNYREVGTIPDHYSYQSDVARRQSLKSLSSKEEWEGVRPVNLKTLSVNVDQLMLIPGTEYLTDGRYLFYRYHFLGTIEADSLRIIHKDFIEDSTSYFFRNMSVEKEKLKVRLIK